MKNYFLESGTLEINIKKWKEQRNVKYVLVGTGNMNVSIYSFQSMMGTVIFPIIKDKQKTCVSSFMLTTRIDLKLKIFFGEKNKL